MDRPRGHRAALHLYAMDPTVLNLAVPSLTASLNPTAAQLLWIVDIYGFFVAGSLLGAAIILVAAITTIAMFRGMRPATA